MVVVGGIARDIQGRSQETFTLGTSNVGGVQWTWGGVGRNIATAAKYTGSDVHLVTAIGSDPTGKDALSHLQSQGIVVTT